MKNEAWKTNPPDCLKAIAVELRLMGVREEVVRHYLYCGDNSVESMLRFIQDGYGTVEEYNTRHYEHLREYGKIE